MEKFEYETITISLKKTISFKKRNLDSDLIKDKMNELGEQGWEYVAKIDSFTDGWTNNIVLVFKRRKES